MQLTKIYGLWNRIKTIIVTIHTYNIPGLALICWKYPQVTHVFKMFMAMEFPRRQ